MEELLEKAKKIAEGAEVFWTTRRETPAHFEANRLKMLQTRESTWVALRIIRNGRIGSSSTTRLDRLDSLVEQAVEMSEFGVPATFELPKHGSFPKVEVYDPQTEKITIREMVHLGQSMIDQVRAKYPEVLCEGGVTRSISQVNILNSKGVSASYKKSGFALDLDGTLIRGTDMLFVGDYDVSCSPIRDTKPVVDQVMQELEWAKETVSAPPESSPVVLTSRAVAGALVFPLTLALNGESLVQGSSPLIGKLGQKVFDEKLSLWDDPTISFRPSSRAYDDEGIPSQKTPLIEKGVIANFFFDLQTAGQAKARSTGSASRFGSPNPSPATTLEVIGEGDTPNDSIIANVEDGLLVFGLLGAGQGNIMGGDFGGNVLLGYRIKQGQVIGRVKDTMIAGNIYECLKSSLVLGNKAEWVGGGLLTPPVCLQGITISSRGPAR